MVLRRLLALALLCAPVRVRAALGPVRQLEDVRPVPPLGVPRVPPFSTASVRQLEAVRLALPSRPGDSFSRTLSCMAGFLWRGGDHWVALISVGRKGAAVLEQARQSFVCSALRFAVPAVPCRVPCAFAPSCVIASHPAPPRPNPPALGGRKWPGVSTPSTPTARRRPLPLLSKAALGHCHSAARHSCISHCGPVARPAATALGRTLPPFV